MALTRPGATWQRKPPPGYGIDPASPVARGLAYCHVLNEGTGPAARDSGPYGRHATLNIATASNATGSVWQPSPGGLAVAGSGTTFIGSAVGHILSQFTHEAIFVPATTTGQGISSVSNGNGSGTADRGIGIDGSGHFYFGIFDGAQRTATGTTVAAAGKKYHLAGVADGTNIYIYVNGLLEGTSVAGSAFTGFSPPTLIYGQDLSNLRGYSATDGSLVLHRIWERPLTAPEVAGLAAAPYAMFRAPSVRWTPTAAAVTPFPWGEPAPCRAPTARTVAVPY